LSFCGLVVCKLGELIIILPIIMFYCLHMLINMIFY